MTDAVHLNDSDLEKKIFDMKAGDSGFTEQSALFPGGWFGRSLQLNQSRGVSKLPNEIECVEIFKKSDGSVVADASRCHGSGQIRPKQSEDFDLGVNVSVYIRPGADNTKTTHP